MSGRFGGWLLRAGAIALLAAAAGLAARSTGVLGWLQRNSVDARFSLRGARHAPADIVLVGIDSDSLGVLPRHPFPRVYDAHVLERLHAAGARLIVYDESFDQAAGPEAESIALYEAAGEAAPVVFATTLISPFGETKVLGGNAKLASIHARAGAAYVPVDPDGVIRHTVAQVNRLPSIAMVVADELMGNPPPARLFENGWIDFRGPPGTFKALSFARVLHNQFKPDQVRGKIVVIGDTAPLLQDLHDTAAGSLMPGPEVQANAISTALDDFPLRSPPTQLTILLIVLLALVMPLASLRLGTLALAATWLISIIAWSLAVQLAFNSGSVLDYPDPLAALAVGGAGALALSVWRERREHRELRMQFAAATGGLVEEVLHDPARRRLEPTAVIAGYRLEEEIGRGGMGVVYRATQLALERPVAVKLIATERAQDPSFRERFKLESRVAASIEHASVIPVFEAGEDDQLLFIAMRLIDGADLALLLDRGGPLEFERTARILSEIGGALDAAHARGLVHRDVKPANILLSRDEPEHSYLTDFGVARRMGAMTRITTAGQIVGTLDYLAPEHIRGEDVDGRADVYALAGVVYHCLTGRTPFPRQSQAATMWAHITAPAPAPSRVRPDLPAAVDEVIARGLAKAPGERYPTASALAQAFAAAIGVGELQAPITARPSVSATRGTEPGPTIVAE